MLQRLTEDFEYAHILDRALQCSDSCEQMCYVAAFTVSSYATTTNRTGKPFNPLLGETYECDRMDDLGWRAITEQAYRYLFYCICFKSGTLLFNAPQVSHHPPAAAQYTEGRGWTLWQEFTMSSKFRGKYLSIIPLGISHLEFKKYNFNEKKLFDFRSEKIIFENFKFGECLQLAKSDDDCAQYYRR